MCSQGIENKYFKYWVIIILDFVKNVDVFIENLET